MPVSDDHQTQLEHRIGVILRMTVVVELLLIVSTGRLWFCAADFPRVPLVAVFLQIPTFLVRTVSCALLVALLASAFSGWRQQCGPRKSLSTATLLLGCAAVCCNQQCLQPWHWLFLLIMTFRVALSLESLPWVLSRLIPGIYVFAAVSRLGPGIDSGISRQIVMTLLDIAGLNADAMAPKSVSSVCALATTAELATGLLLLVRRTQRTGLVASVLMHVTLMLILGPLGLNQHVAVVIWNGFLGALAIFLFWKPAKHPLPGRVFSTVAAAFCVIWPTLGLFGITDNWTGWQLYSPRPEVLQLQVHADAVSELPPSVIPWVGKPDLLDEWCSVRMDRWSLESSGVPLYPQARFQLAIAAAITTGVTNNDHVRARLVAPSIPKWWDRTATDFSGKAEIQRASRAGSLNGKAVSTW